VAIKFLGVGLAKFFLHTQAIWSIIEISQIIISGRIAYGPAEKRIYVNRAAGGYRNYCTAYGDIDAGIAEGQKTGTSHNLP